MFWRFGFASTSTLDTLLDKPGLTIEDLLDEDDLLQECKAGNTKLVDFLSQTRVIKRLFEHVVGSAEVSGPGGRQWEEKVRFKYPYVASEVLSSDIFSIVESALAHQDELLDPFWSAVLHPKPSHVQPPFPHHSHPLLAGSPSSSPIPPGKNLPGLAGRSDDGPRTFDRFGGGGSNSGSSNSSRSNSRDRRGVHDSGYGSDASDSKDHGAVLIRASDNGPGKSVLAGYWAKVNGVFLDKKPREMLAYIRGLPRIVQRFIAHLETPAVVDLLYRIISCEQSLPAAGVIDWLSSEELIPQIVELLSPSHSVDLHNTVSELIKAIIALSAPSPAGMGAGQDGFGYGAGGGMASFGQPEQPVGVVNKLVRELASEPVVKRMVSFMLDSTHPSNLTRRLSEVALADIDLGDNADEDSDDESSGVLSFKSSNWKRKPSTTSGRLGPPGALSTLNEDSALDDTDDGDDTDPQPLNPSMTPAYESSKSPAHRDSTTTLRPTDFFPPVKAPECAVSPETCSSSLITGIGILIELIRKNNSDYFEQHLFHALRAHLLQRQQEISAERDKARAEGTLKDEPKDEDDEEMEGMEEAMAEMTDKLGIVHLGPMLRVLCERLGEFQELISRSQNQEQMITTTLGKVRPLTFERYRIMELYAELLHCSNMALLNRAPGEGPQYSQDGILQGGIQGLQVLARTLQGADADDSTASESAVPGGGASEEATQDTEVAAQQASQTASPPPSGRHTRQHSSIGSSTGDASTEPAADVSVTPAVEGSAAPAPSTDASNPSEEDDEDAKSIRSALSSLSLADLTSPKPSGPSTPVLGAEADDDGDDAKLDLVAGDLLKRKFLDAGILQSILTLFFEYPWNNFLHNVVYDVLQQCFNGRMDTGLNRKLTVAVFQRGKLPEKILEGHRRNEESMAGPRRIRLGFMGHMNLIAEETVKLLERYPREVGDAVAEAVPKPEWDDFVSETLKENREKESAPLAGGRPMAAGGGQFGSFGGMGEGAGSSAGVGQPSDNAFANYLSRQMSGAGNTSDDDDDSDDEGGNWMSSAGAHHAGGGAGGGFEDVFDPSSAGGSATAGRGITATTGTADGDEDDDDDEWGPFGSSSAIDEEAAAVGDFGEYISPATRQPLTSADWAASAFDDEDGFGFGNNAGEVTRRASNGSAGEQSGQGDSPPRSPSSGSEDNHTPFVDLSDASTYRNLNSSGSGIPVQTHHRRRSSASSNGDANAPGGAGIAQFRQTASTSPGTLATSPTSATTMQQQRQRRRSSSGGSSSAASGSGSTDPSAAHAASQDGHPLGPGVAGDAEVKDGMLQRVLDDGTVVTVPLDDVALAVEAGESRDEGTQTHSESDDKAAADAALPPTTDATATSASKQGATGEEKRQTQPQPQDSAANTGEPAETGQTSATTA